MQERVQPKNSSLFLMELIISIFFFVLCSSICLNLFVNARLMSKSAEQLNEAVNISSSINEIIGVSRTLDETKNLIVNCYKDNRVDGDTVTVLGKKCIVICTLNEEDKWIFANVIAYENENIIYSIDLKHYLFGGMEHE